ncbi:putative gustatory receptor 28b [Anopheles moucheti]|uniref:putative gustatory receptor 28b n=1 Tax=Anopheles moucheti TaxID=186751 RepID=UPI0022F0CAEF|nr:putative gustatory receptor 28b [Anopheles moucheti]
MLVQKLKTLFFELSANWWTEFRQWEHLCCPQRTTVRLVFLFLFFLLLELSVFVITLLYIPSRIDTGSFFLDNGVPAILIIGTTGSVFGLTHMLSQRSQIGGVSLTLQHFDRTLQQLDFRLRCEQISYWTTGWFVTVLITTILFSIAIQVFGSMVFNNLNTIVLIAFINVTNIPYIIFTVWFLVCELCVSYRVRLLHSLLEGEMRSMATTSRMDNKVKRPSHLIAGLTDLHAELTIAVRHIRAVFSMHITVTFGAYVILLIFCIFSYYRAAVVLGEIETNFAWLTGCWSLYNSCFLIPKVLFGAWIRMEADRLTKLVHYHLRNSREQMVQNQLYILSQQLEHHSFSIRTGLFTINWPVYASVIGYISTYVVILIQFDNKAMDISKANTPPIGHSL